MLSKSEASSILIAKDEIFGYGVRMTLENLAH
jgi:hypothetical protein